MLADRPTPESGRAALLAHAMGRAELARRLYGPRLDWAAMQRVLSDARLVRHPVRLVFDTRGLLPGEFACLEPPEAGGAEGFRLLIDPRFENDQQALPLVVAYHLAWVNYGDAAGPQEAEAFGAALCGLSTEEYHQRLLGLAALVAGSSADGKGQVA